MKFDFLTPNFLTKRTNNDRLQKASLTMSYKFRFAILSITFACVLPGCGGMESKDEGDKQPLPEDSSAYVPQVPVTTVKGGSFDEFIDLPGVSVRGLESTPLHAKVGGFVKTIRRIGHAEDSKGRQVQVTDTYDAQTKKATQIEFRVVDAGTGKVYKSPVFEDAKLKSLNNSEFREIYKQLVDDKKMMEIDLGTRVQSDTLLAVLDIPEMADEIAKQQAHIKSAGSVVSQKRAAVTSAKALRTLRSAEAVAAEKMAEAAKAKFDQISKKFDRIKKLGGAVDKEVLEEVTFEKRAAQVGWQSAKKQTESAKAAVEVAKAGVSKSEADEKVAKAAAEEANAELDRLQTLAGYAEIRAPFTGTITRRMVHHGQFVQPAKDNSAAMPMFVLTRTDVVRVVIPVPGRKSYKIEPGQSLWLHTIGGLPGVTIAGKITQGAATLDDKSRMKRVEWFLKNPAVDSHLIRKGRQWVQRPGAKKNDKPRIVRVRPGMFGTVTVHRKWQDLRKVPAAAVGREGTQNFVYEVGAGAGGKSAAIKRYVTVVYNDAKEVGISDGIAAGAKIVAGNIASLKDGQEISTESD